MKTEVKVKIESSLCKPGSNKAIAKANDVLSTTKTASLSAINGANLLEARVAPTKESVKKKQKSVPSAKKKILLAKKTILSAKTSTDPDPTIKSFLSTKCSGCKEFPCTNIKKIVSVHSCLKKKYYDHLGGYAPDPNNGNSRRQMAFYCEYNKETGEVEPDLCAQEFARIWFPRND
jgi:hypothetical protein